MSKTEKQLMEDNALGQPTDSQPTEQLEVSEQPSDVDESFLAEEVIPVGDAEVVFKTDPDDIVQAVDDDARVGSDFWTDDGDWKATVVWTTPGGADLQVVKRSEGAGYKLQYSTGGVLPGIYSGWYTSFDKAKEAAIAYMNETYNAETKIS